MVLKCCFVIAENWGATWFQARNPPFSLIFIPAIHSQLLQTATTLYMDEDLIFILQLCNHESFTNGWVIKQIVNYEHFWKVETERLWKLN